jgi:Tol biopolymer transport system component
VDDASRARDVFVLAMDLSVQVHAVAHPADDELAGWSPDGRFLLFTSNRRDGLDLLALRWANGAPQGEPQLLQPDLKGESLGLTSSGALITQQFISDRSIQLVSIDLASGRIVEPPARVMPVGTSQNPAWSPDGRQLAYTTVRDGRWVIGIRTMETGATRHVDAQALASMQGLTWAPDGRSFVVSGANPTGRYGIYTIDAQSGALAPLVVPIDEDDQLSYEGFFWSPDGRRLYYHSQNGKIHERDNASGDVREVVRGEYGPISLSPDGRWIATEKRRSGDTPASLVLVSPATGEVREIFSLAPGQSVNNVAMPWTADSRSVLLRKMLSATGERSELWVVPIDGSSPRLVDFDANRIVAFAVGKMRLHPDGRQLAFVGGTSRVEVWALENFLPRSR